MRCGWLGKEDVRDSGWEKYGWISAESEFKIGSLGIPHRAP